MGYDAMQLAGPHVFGPPKDVDAALAVLREAVEQRTPFNRLGTAEELADVVVFLCSDRSNLIQGQTLVADGGFSLM